MSRYQKLKHFLENNLRLIIIPQPSDIAQIQSEIQIENGKFSATFNTV